MARLSEVDARLLESLEAKYGPQELVTVIQSLTPSIAEVHPNEAAGISPEENTL